MQRWIMQKKIELELNIVTSSYYQVKYSKTGDVQLAMFPSPEAQLIIHYPVVTVRRIIAEFIKDLFARVHLGPTFLQIPL